MKISAKISMQINIEHMHTYKYDAHCNFGNKLEKLNNSNYSLWYLCWKISQKNSSKLKHAICFPHLAQNVLLEQFRKFVLF